MGAAANYAYLHGRVSVLSEGLLPEGLVNKLIASPPEEELDLLAGAAFEHIDSPTLADPGALEEALLSDLVDDFTILAHALSGTARDLLVYWARRYELSNLKAIIRGKMVEENVATIRAQLVDIGPFATLPVEDLLRTDDTAELLRRVEATPYGDIARQARRVYEEQQELFALDAAVDRRYFAGLAKRAKAVDAGEGDQLRALIGSIIDRMNLSWLLRYRFAYSFDPAEAYYLLIPAGYRVSSSQLLELAQLPSVEEVYRHFPDALRDDSIESPDISEVDRILCQATWKMAEGILRRTAFNLARAFAYLVLRERDIDRIHAVIKGKRLNLGSDRIRVGALLDVSSTPAQPAMQGT